MQVDVEKLVPGATVRFSEAAGLAELVAVDPGEYWTFVFRDERGLDEITLSEEEVGGVVVIERRDQPTFDADPHRFRLGLEVWVNWIVRRRADSRAVGTVQATVQIRDATALVAWVIGVEWQRQGFASEAARALVDWLQQRGIDDVAAHIHPEHRASAIVASRAGLEPTDEEADGERVWRTPAARPARTR
jgi:hypothetical protein